MTKKNNQTISQSSKKINPRWKTGRRRKYQSRFRAMGLPCAICGRPIDYDLPYTSPYSFVIDEIIPISKFAEGGYNSQTQAADDFNNLQPAHRICNARKGNKINFKITSVDMQKGQNTKKFIKQDGKW